MGTFGRDTARDNWFFSDGALDNQAWAQALAVAATGRITQLTAYMAGDTAAMTGGPALWDAAGNLLLYSATGIARRSGPYSGGFDGTGRNQNDGYYINVYGFNHTFTNPTTFINGAFRNSGDSWILGNSDRFGNIGRLKTVVGSSPSTATGGNDWAHEAASFPGFPEGYATYTPLGIFARVGGLFVPVIAKRFFDTTVTYFDTVMADGPMMYWRLDEGSSPVVNYGSGWTPVGGAGFEDLTIFGAPATGQSGLIVDPDTAMRFDQGPHYNFFQYCDDAVGRFLPSVSSFSDIGPLNWTVEAWIKQYSHGRDHPGFGFANDIIAIHRSSADGTPFQIVIANGTDVFVNDGSWDYAGLPNNAFYEEHAFGAVSVGPTYHIAVTYESTGFAGDGNLLGGTGTLKIYVNGVLVTTAASEVAFRQNFFPHSSNVASQALSIGNGGIGGNSFSADAAIDEVAMYDHALTAAQIAHHYAVGTGATGGLASTGATLYVRNDSNTAWIALNFALKQQEMPERREFPVRAVYPDGSYQDLLGRWEEDNPQTFGATLKDAFRRAKSGLFVPARSQRVLGYA